ncbi:peptidase S8/S53 domain-containing protein [Trichoderma chlorosporum]
MHRPYVRGSLSYHVRTIDTVRDNSSVPHHPAILAFAKLLIDVERGRKISDKEYMMTNGRKNEWLTISTILTTKLSGSLSVHYTTAIQSCLNFSRVGRRDANQTDTDYKYQNIVVPLQQELAHYSTSNDSILNLENEELHLSVTDILDVEEAPQMFPASQSLHLARRTGPEASIPVQEVYMQGQAASMVLIDDFENGGNNIQLAKRADNFFNLLDEWRDKRHNNIQSLQAESPKQDGQTRQVRIAILDTGLDVNNPTFKGTLLRLKGKRQNGEKPIKAIKFFVGDNWKDEDGHGTLTTSILLRVAPRADIFIAKIASGRTTGQCSAIAEAITKAVDTWNVDIIVMPFGVGSERDAIRTAISNADHRGKILIASAANSGGNTGRAFPAEDERVICMHASDGNGNDSGGFNPSPLPNKDNFTTLGLGIKFHWLNQEMYKSGTSYSAPVAAGIAANLLDFISHPALGKELSSAQRKELRTGAGMKKVFRLLAENRNGYGYVQPWRLWKDELNEKDVWSIIKARLLESS